MFELASKNARSRSRWARRLSMSAGQPGSKIEPSLPRTSIKWCNQARFIITSALPSYNFPVTKERWAQVGITIEFLIIVRTLGEFFRLRHALGPNFSTVAAPYVGGGLIAACSCWMAVTLYFFRRYTLSACIALGTVPILLAYKVAVIGR